MASNLRRTRSGGNHHGWRVSYVVLKKGGRIFGFPNQALEAVRAGARRKIGNGEDTLVWSMPWLPEVSNGFVRTAESSHMSYVKVSNLMNIGEKSWDVDLLRDVFCSRDVELIQRIPIPLIETVDSWYWLMDEKGVFTVKSYYRWIKGECENTYGDLWKRLWSLKLPQKVSKMVWRLCKGCLPTNVALVSRHVNIGASCPWCHCQSETDVHVMFLCDFARTMWLTTGLAQLVQCSPYESACEVFARVFEQGTIEQCAEIAILCWSLWERRNKWVWERANGSVFGVRQKVNHNLRDWKEAQMKTMKCRIRGEIGAKVWRPPKEGWMKINVDAAVFVDGSIGVAVVVRDHQAKFVATRGVQIAGAWKPREAKAIGLKEALSWVIGRGYSYCVFETDSLVLADACNGSPVEAF